MIYRIKKFRRIILIKKVREIGINIYNTDFEFITKLASTKL